MLRGARWSALGCSLSANRVDMKLLMMLGNLYTLVYDLEFLEIQ